MHWVSPLGPSPSSAGHGQTAAGTGGRPGPTGTKAGVRSPQGRSCGADRLRAAAQACLWSSQRADGHISTADPEPHGPGKGLGPQVQPSWGSQAKGQRGLTVHLAPQDLCLQLEASRAEAAGLREQLAGRQQELRGARRLLQEQARECEDLLDKLEAQNREAQRCRAASQLLAR